MKINQNTFLKFWPAEYCGASFVLTGWKMIYFRYKQHFLVWICYLSFTLLAKLTYISKYWFSHNLVVVYVLLNGGVQDTLSLRYVSYSKVYSIWYTLSRIKPSILFLEWPQLWSTEKPDQLNIDFCIKVWLSLSWLLQERQK